MDIDGTTVKDKSVNMLDCSENIDNNTEVTDSKKKPTLTDDDLNNFKKSISYVSINNRIWIFDLFSYSYLNLFN